MRDVVILATGWLVIYMWRASWHIYRNRPVVIKTDDGHYRVPRDLRDQRARR